MTNFSKKHIGDLKMRLKPLFALFFRKTVLLQAIIKADDRKEFSNRDKLLQELAIRLFWEAISAAWYLTLVFYFLTPPVGALAIATTVLIGIGIVELASFVGGLLSRAIFTLKALDQHSSKANSTLEKPYFIFLKQSLIFGLHLSLPIAMVGFAAVYGVDTASILALSLPQTLLVTAAVVLAFALVTTVYFCYKFWKISKEGNKAGGSKEMSFLYYLKRWFFSTLFGENNLGNTQDLARIVSFEGSQKSNKHLPGASHSNAENISSKPSSFQEKDSPYSPKTKSEWAARALLEEHLTKNTSSQAEEDKQEAKNAEKQQKQDEEPDSPPPAEVSDESEGEGPLDADEVPSLAVVETHPLVRSKRNHPVLKNSAEPAIVDYRFQPILVPVEHGVFISVFLSSSSPPPSLGMQFSLPYFMSLYAHLEAANQTYSSPTKKSHLVLMEEDAPIESFPLEEHAETSSFAVDLAEAKDASPPPPGSNVLLSPGPSSEYQESQQSLSLKQVEKVKPERRGNPDDFDFGSLNPSTVEPIYRPRLIVFKEENQVKADKLPPELTRTELFNDESCPYSPFPSDKDGVWEKKYDALGLSQFQRQMNDLTIQYERKCFKVDTGEHIDVYSNLNFLSPYEKKVLQEYHSNQSSDAVRRSTQRRLDQDRAKRRAEDAEKDAQHKAEIEDFLAKARAEREASDAKYKAEQAERDAKYKAEQAEQAERDAKHKAEMKAQQSEQAEQNAKFNARFNDMRTQFMAEFEESGNDPDLGKIGKILGDYLESLQQTICPQSSALGDMGVFSPQHIASVSQSANASSCQQEAMQQGTTPAIDTSPTVAVV
jgi:hypothetical protein